MSAGFPRGHKRVLLDTSVWIYHLEQRPEIISMALVNLIVALALLQFFGFGAAVARARGKYKVAAPATTGNELFERYYRVQMNTLELLVMLVPAMWMFGFYVNADAAAGLGALYLVGRIIYFFAYVADPGKRELGYVLSAGPVVVLVIGAIVGAALRVAHYS